MFRYYIQMSSFVQILILLVMKIFCQTNSVLSVKVQSDSLKKSHYFHTPDPVLLSIEEKLKEIRETQKVLQNTNDLEIISQRLQNVEEHITKAETYNKMRLGQLSEYNMKEEFIITDMKGRIEKNQQQINVRFSEIDEYLDKLSKTHQNLEKEIRKLNSAQNNLVATVEELNEKIKKTQPEELNIAQLINTTQQQLADNLILTFQKMIQKDRENSVNATNNETLRISQNDITKSSSIIKEQLMNDVEKMVKTESDKIIAHVDNIYNTWRDDSKKSKSIVDECISLGNKIYTKISTESNDMENFSSAIDEEFIGDTRSQFFNSSKHLGKKLLQNVDRILNEQQSFSNNCHRLRVHEEQIEDKIVKILGNLFSYIDNKTENIQIELDILINNEQTKYLNEENLMEELTKSIREKNSLIDRLEKYSLSKVSQLETNFTLLNADIVLLQRSILIIDDKIQSMRDLLLPSEKVKSERTFPEKVYSTFTPKTDRNPSLNNGHSKALDLSEQSSEFDFDQE